MPIPYRAPAEMVIFNKKDGLDAKMYTLSEIIANLQKEGLEIAEKGNKYLKKSDGRKKGDGDMQAKRKERESVEREIPEAVEGR